MVLPIIPPILALLTPPTWKSKFVNFFYHLPPIQVCKCFKFQVEIAKEAKQVSKWDSKSLLIQEEIRQLEKKLEGINDIEERGKCLLEIKAKKVDYRGFATNKEISEVRKRDAEAAMQEFKYVDAFGENYPQLILQQTILLKGAKWTALTFLSIITSCYSAFTTMAGLTVSLPFYINGIKRIQFKDFVLEYCIILPLIFFVVVPRIYTFCTFFAFFGEQAKDKTLGVKNELIGSLIFLIFFLIYYVAFKMIVHNAFKKWKRSKENDQTPKTVFQRIVNVLIPTKGLDKEAAGFIRQSLLSSLLIPTTIFNPHMTLYRDLNILTTVMYSLLSFVSLILATFFDEYLEMPSYAFTDDSQESKKFAYQIICGVQIGALLIGFAASYLIFYIIKKKNMPNLFLWAYEDQDYENFNALFPQSFDHNAINREGKNVILLALERKDKATFTWICQAGPKVFDFTATDQDGKSCLIYAIQQGLTDAVKQVLPKLEIDVINKRDYRSWNALRHSIGQKQIDTISSLLNIEGIDVDTPSDEDGKTCLIWATELKLSKAISHLVPKMRIENINALDKKGHTALMHAWKLEQIDIVQTLLKIKDLNISDEDEEDGRTCLIWAIENNLDQIVLTLLPLLNHDEINDPDWNGRSPFMIACIYNSTKVVQLMLEQSTQYKIDVHKVDSYGRNAFIYACSSNADQVVLLLLQNSFKFSEEIKQCDTDGWNCFLWACQSNAHRVVPILLENANKYKINIHATDRVGYSAFLLACADNRDKVIKILIEQSQEYKIPLNHTDARGNSGFILACKNKHYRTVKLLLEKSEEFKIDLKLKNRDKKTGYDIWPQYFKK